MAEKNSRRNQTTDALFDAILSLRTREECYNFFEDLCTVKEISDMAQRLEAALCKQSQSGGHPCQQLWRLVPGRAEASAKGLCRSVGAAV